QSAVAIPRAGSGFRGAKREHRAGGDGLAVAPVHRTLGGATAMNLWSRWVSFLERREDATALAVCRIIAGATLCRELVGSFVDGAAMAVWVDEKFGGIRPLSSSVLDSVGGATPENVRGLLAVGVVAAFLMAIGAFTRLTSIAAWFCFRTLSLLNE